MILARNSITLSHVRDIISTTWYYRLQTSTASPPSKPDTETPAGWTTVEPSYTSGSTSSLYVTMQTAYSDGSFDYSDVSLSSSFEAAKEAYNKAAAAQSSVDEITPELIVGTHGTTATNTWKGTSTRLTTLAPGTRIQYKLSSAASSAAVTLNLTLKGGGTTGAKNVYYNNTTRLGTQYGINAVIELVYDGTAWRVLNPYTNSNTIGVLSGPVTAGGNGIKNYGLVMRDTESTWVSLTTTAGDGTEKERYTGGLYPGKVMHMGSNAAYASGAQSGNCYDALALNLRYSTNCGTTLVKGGPVYLVGEIHDDGLFYLDETWWTQTEPTAVDGKTYIYLGIAYSTTSIYLVADNPPMRYADGKFRTLAEIDAARAQATADGKNTVYHTAAAPAGTDHTEGDVWFNTANGNEIKIWDGAQWAASKLADDALDVLTVAKAIISYLDVGSLSAGDITALLAVFKKISSKDGRNYWNLETGLFHTEKGEFTGSVTGSTITGSSLQTTNGTTATFDYSTSNGGISNRGASSSADSHVTVSARGVKHYHSDDDSDAAAIKAQVIPALMNGTEYGWYITPMAYIRKLFTDKGQVVCKPELNSVISSLNTTIGQINTRVGALLASSTPATGVTGVSGNVCGQTAMLYFSNFSFTVSGSGSTAAVSTGQLNAAYYPARTLDLVDTLNGVRFTISTSGEIKVSGSLSATKAIRGTFTYIRANVSLGTNASTLTPVSYNYE